MKIVWSPIAISDLIWIQSYITTDSPKAALKVTRLIKSSISRLRRFPLSGKAGREAGTRELIIPGTSYIAIYAIRPDQVWIAAILHGRQHWPK